MLIAGEAVTNNNPPTPSQTQTPLVYYYRYDYFPSFSPRQTGGARYIGPLRYRHPIGRQGCDRPDGSVAVIIVCRPTVRSSGSCKPGMETV